ncbi:snRNA-activating protein complex subunit 5 [Protopterus annectens]|uniref:snRNA-activating protein complex subunit 5 n=1 Tax=Protopterus annectens TaxID=7888 RepID=UPI001CFB212E|nr:snRNA-activating protein complex subunit 5 [Protopterus annectens]XP_043933808.1 snRNA-activating protein complex subunit 5 [Protopterus annectens]XP_043933809.1 snRNA-activating protein complex subunit 5 [Protopterus annectens]
MLSRLQELKKEEESLLKIKAALHDQLNRLKVEELALRSMISLREENDSMYCTSETPDPVEVSFQADNESAINQTELQLSTKRYEQCSEEEEEEEEELET